MDNQEDTHSAAPFGAPDRYIRPTLHSCIPVLEDLDALKAFPCILIHNQQHIATSVKSARLDPNDFLCFVYPQGKEILRRLCGTVFVCCILHGACDFLWFRDLWDIIRRCTGAVCTG